MVLIVDVGANDGAMGKFLLDSNSSTKVIAVEPNFEICGPILLSIQEKYNGRFKYVNGAVAEKSGRGKLFSHDVMNGQVASLLKINANSKWNPKVSSHFAKSNLESHIEVNMISVSDLIADHQFSKIDFLKIDTQGTDLIVLKEFLRSVDVQVVAVEVEATFDNYDLHYESSENSLENLFPILKEFRMHIMKMVPAGPDCSEYNIFLSKSANNYEEIDRELHFERIPTFSRFWNVLGMGTIDDESVRNLQRKFWRKFLNAFQHPKKSYKSVLLKLTR